MWRLGDPECRRRTRSVRRRPTRAMARDGSVYMAETLRRSGRERQEKPYTTRRSTHWGEASATASAAPLATSLCTAGSRARRAARRTRRRRVGWNDSVEGCASSARRARHLRRLQYAAPGTQSSYGDRRRLARRGRTAVGRRGEGRRLGGAGHVATFQAAEPPTRRRRCSTISVLPRRRGGCSAAADVGQLEAGGGGSTAARRLLRAVPDDASIAATTVAAAELLCEGEAILPARPLRRPPQDGRAIARHFLHSDDWLRRRPQAAAQDPRHRRATGYHSF